MKPVSMRALALAAALTSLSVPALAAELSPQARAQITGTVERQDAHRDGFHRELHNSRRIDEGRETKSPPARKISRPDQKVLRKLAYQ